MNVDDEHDGDIPGYVIISRMFEIHDRVLNEIRDQMNRGISIAEIARRCNTHSSKLSIMIHNKKELWNCTLRTLVGLAKGLGINITIKGD